MRILLVEDEERIAAFIRKGLMEELYAVDVARDGGEGLDLALVAEYDLIILDVRLPVRDGIAVCRELRARGDTTPILMLTARDTVDDRVRGLDAGADDYLVKPFFFKELLARLRALARRPPVVQEPILTAENLMLDTRTHQVEREGQPIELTAREYRMLELFMRHPGQVLTRLQIAEQVWGYDFDAHSNVVDVYIRYLRRKVDDPFEPKLIQTVRGAGYKFEATRV
ncbi:MAG TPA: response regulator transcription factor [Anaerolineae bacterium]|nr:response regulator transcription factor [Anaerolineae bacterium]